LWAIVIFVGSSTPGQSVSNIALIDFLAHKAVHVLEYVIFYLLLYRATKSYSWSFLILLIYAISDEIHQSFVPGRSPKITDVIIDLGSGSLGALLIWKLLPTLPLKLKTWLLKYLRV
jgi:VanZ family protein